MFYPTYLSLSMYHPIVCMCHPHGNYTLSQPVHSCVRLCQTVNWVVRSCPKWYTRLYNAVQGSVQWHTARVVQGCIRLCPMAHSKGCTRLYKALSNGTQQGLYKAVQGSVKWHTARVVQGCTRLCHMTHSKGCTRLYNALSNGTQQGLYKVV